MTVSKIVRTVRPADRQAAEAAWQKWDSVAKPLRSLGLLEDDIVRIAAMTGGQVSLDKRAVVVMCADNGVVAQGVTQTGQEVTAIVTENMARAESSVCRMAQVARADIIPVDIGVARPVVGEKILQRCVRRGTADFTQGPAMSRAECEKAILTGVEVAGELISQGYRLLATGEMGIGNTTTTAAVASLLLHCDPTVVTGRGAGLSSSGLERKISAIRRGIEQNQPNPDDTIDILSKVGGLDLAGLVGVFLGGALHRTPVLIDGVISAAAALAAVRLCPAAADYMLASHVSGEPAGQLLLDALQLQPILHAGMCLGEGTGAVAVMPLLDMAAVIFNEMSTFDQINIDAYEHLN